MKFLGSFGGLFNFTLNSSLFQIVLYLISAIILLLTGFYKRKLYINLFYCVLKNLKNLKNLNNKLIYYKTNILEMIKNKYKIMDYGLIIFFIITSAILLPLFLLYMCASGNINDILRSYFICLSVFVMSFNGIYNQKLSNKVLLKLFFKLCITNPRFIIISLFNYLKNNYVYLIILLWSSIIIIILHRGIYLWLYPNGNILDWYLYDVQMLFSTYLFICLSLGYVNKYLNRIFNKNYDEKEYTFIKILSTVSFSRFIILFLFFFIGKIFIIPTLKSLILIPIFNSFNLQNTLESIQNFINRTINNSYHLRFIKRVRIINNGKTHFINGRRFCSTNIIKNIGGNKKCFYFKNSITKPMVYNNYETKGSYLILWCTNSINSGVFKSYEPKVSGLVKWCANSIDSGVFKSSETEFRNLVKDLVKGLLKWCENPIINSYIFKYNLSFSGAKTTNSFKVLSTNPIGEYETDHYIYNIIKNRINPFIFMNTQNQPVMQPQQPQQVQPNLVNPAAPAVASAGAAGGATAGGGAVVQQVQPNIVYTDYILAASRSAPSQALVIGEWGYSYYPHTEGVGTHNIGPCGTVRYSDTGTTGGPRYSVDHVTINDLNNQLPNGFQNTGTNQPVARNIGHVLLSLKNNGKYPIPVVVYNIPNMTAFLYGAAGKNLAPGFSPDLYIGKKLITRLLTSP